MKSFLEGWRGSFKNHPSQGQETFLVSGMGGGVSYAGRDEKGKGGRNFSTTIVNRSTSP